jgi:hypothetical protein
MADNVPNAKATLRTMPDASFAVAKDRGSQGEAMVVENRK